MRVWRRLLRRRGFPLVAGLDVFGGVQGRAYSNYGGYRGIVYQDRGENVDLTGGYTLFKTVGPTFKKKVVVYGEEARKYEERPGRYDELSRMYDGKNISMDTSGVERNSFGNVKLRRF